MLIQIRCSIDNKEADNIFDMFASSKDYRDSIDIVDNSLIPRSYVLYIDVADEAGAIATIATILATEKVSIKNIGEEEAIRVISRKPPAAIIFIYWASLSRRFTRFTRAEATI